ncbi:MAG: hypothetical protein J6C55_02815 [Oscillospiraceae bacterium]|nr:hypothetical protein [Oscillospiraceae bacterium]
MILSNNFDFDSDIKRYNIGSKKSDESLESSENPSDFLIQKSEGNLKKAKQVGVDLCNYILFLDKRIYKNKNFENNKKILLWFASTAALEKTIKNEYVLSAAKASLSQTLKLNNLRFYNIIRQSLATSFFALCNRPGRGLKDFGKYFAYLSERENNKNIIKIGILIYIIFFSLSKRKIKNIIYNINLEDV